MRELSILRLDGPLDDTLSDPVLVVALDGWTDAGRAGSMSGETLQEQWQTERIGAFDPDAIFDYRDRRPLLTIDRGILGDPIWPELELRQLSAPGGTTVLLLHGAEPDFHWQEIAEDLATLAELVGARRYVGLGAVPGPVPHTRPVSLVTTGSDEEQLERLGRPHERLTVPASCQVVLEACLRDAGLTTLGLWARIPHYVAGEYPAGARALLRTLTRELGAELDLRDLSEAADEHQERLDEAAADSVEVLAHISQLEQAYDDEAVADSFAAPLPTGDEIAAELERFLRRQGGDEPAGPG